MWRCQLPHEQRRRYKETNSLSCITSCSPSSSIILHSTALPREDKIFLHYLRITTFISRRRSPSFTMRFASVIVTIAMLFASTTMSSPVELERRTCAACADVCNQASLEYDRVGQQQACQQNSVYHDIINNCRSCCTWQGCAKPVFLCGYF